VQVRDGPTAVSGDESRKQPLPCTHLMRKLLSFEPVELLWENRFDMSNDPSMKWVQGGKARLPITHSLHELLPLGVVEPVLINQLGLSDAPSLKWVKGSRTIRESEDLPG